MSAVTGRRVVVTGKVAGHSRQTAEAFLIEQGATVQAAVGQSTEILVTGAKVGAKKIGDAKAMGVTILTWEQATSDVPIVAAGLTIQEAAAAQEHVEEHGEPMRVIAPMLAQAGELPGSGYQYEVKWDGYRCIAQIKDGRVKLQSRSAKTDYTDQFPHIVGELEDFLLPLGSYVLDGEIVVLDENGRSHFEALHGAEKASESFIVFDVLEVLGTDIRAMPLRMRRDLMEQDDGIEGLTTMGSHVSLSPKWDDPEGLLAYCEEEGLEGIVAKRLESRYQEGRRCDDWIKVKIRCSQEFAIIGWKPGEGAMSGAAGSILLALREGIDWKFVGRVGSGLDYSVWKGFTEVPPLRLQDDRTGLDLSLAKARELDDVTWVDPTDAPVVQVAYQRWTEDGRLWHPSLLGLRTDKDPTDCKREA